MRSIHNQGKRNSIIQSRSRSLRLLFLVTLTASVLGFVGCAKDLSKSSDYVNIDELRLELRTDHFDLYADKSDLYVLPRMAELLESNFDRITGDLQCDNLPRVSVFIYPNLVSFHDGVDWVEDADWFVGYCACPDSIHMVSPLDPGPVHTYHTIMTGLVHEFAHAVTCQIRGGSPAGLPQWLYEGVACYEAGQLPDTELIGDAVIRDQVPGLLELQADFIGNDGYQFSYTIAQYAVETYGMDAVIRLILSPLDYEGAFGEYMTRSAFERGWMAYLREHYQTI